MGNPIRILIVEDNLLIAEDLSTLLQNLGYDVIAKTTNYDDAILELSKNKTDFALLDIQLEGEKSGIDIGKYIRSNYNMPFIYLTSNSDKETVSLAKKTKPNGYLMKPFSKENLYTSIEIALTNSINSENQNIMKKSFVMIKENRYHTKLILDSVEFIKADNVYLEIYTSTKKHVIRSTLKKFYESLPKNQFFRTNKSYVVNIKKVDSLSTNELTINSHTIPIAREYKNGIKWALDL